MVVVISRILNNNALRTLNNVPSNMSNIRNVQHNNNVPSNMRNNVPSNMRNSNRNRE